VCATNLPHRTGLYCASPFIKPTTYDGLGVLRLSGSGRVTRIQGGSDILLAIQGNLDRTPRTTLNAGHAWSSNGYRCLRTTTAVRCRLGSHGFTVPTSATRRAEQIVVTSLRITVWPNGRDHAPTRAYTLTCAPAGGTLPNAAATCARLAPLKAPFAPTPKGTPCTMINGGPQEALVTGRFRGALVRARFSRSDGCEIARWDRVRFLFPS
jgi:hypothetical protein